MKSISLLAVAVATASTALGASWTKLANVPTGSIHEHTTIAISDTQIVVLGGVTQTNQILNAVNLYDIPTNTWKKLANMPVPLNHANSAFVDGKLYVLGGMAGAGWTGTPQSWVYDPKTNVWTTITAMPTSEARGSAAVGVYNKTIWLATGKTGSGGLSVTTVSAYDTVAGKWLSLPAAAKNVPEGRDHGGGAVVGTKFYQIAGSLQSIPNRKDTVFVLDLEAIEKGWTTAKGRMPTPRRGISVGAIGTKIYTFGGEGNPDVTGGIFNNVEVYDTEADAWTKLAPMDLPRHGTFAAAIGGKIYIPAGGTAQGTACTAVFDVFTP